jgi:hypothetical protein
MALKGIKPELIKQAKPKFMISGKSGTGKTHFALNFPSVFYCDCEMGGTREQYKKKLIESGGMYFGPEQGSQDFDEVIGQVKELATTKHPYKTLVIDSFSKLYNIERAIAEERVGSDFGVDKKQANRATRKLIIWLQRIPLNVVLVCHQKDKWSRKDNQLVYEGSTFDGFDKLEYELDLWLETAMKGTARIGTIVKSRIEAFPVGTTMPLEYDSFRKLYGASVIEEEAIPITLVTAEQVVEIRRIVDLLKISPEDMDKWLTKAQATEVEDLSKDNAAKLLEFLSKKLKGEAK